MHTKPLHSLPKACKGLQGLQARKTPPHKATQPQAATKVPPPTQPTIEPVMQGMTRAKWISTVKLTKTHNTRLDFHNLEAKDDSKDMRDWVKEIEDVAQVNAKGTEHGTRADNIAANFMAWGLSGEGGNMA